jgi:hypothetical protein
MARRVAEDLCVFALFVALTVALTWPLTKNIHIAVSDAGDPLLNTWIVDWVSHSLLTDPLRMYDAPILHPARYPLAFSENLVAIALITLPLHIAGIPPLTIYNIAMLLGFAFSGYAAYFLARVVCGSIVPSIIAGIFFAFVSWKFDHLPHLQIIWSGWIPIILALLLLYWRRATIPRAAALSVAFLMNGLTNIYFLLFTAVAVALTIAFLAAVAPQRRLRFWFGLAGALVIAALILVPFLMPYARVSALYGVTRTIPEVRSGSAELHHWMTAPPQSLLYNPGDESRIYPEKMLYPGALVILLTAAALLMGRREGAAPRAPNHNTALYRALDISAGVLATIALVPAWSRELAWRRSDNISDVAMTLAVAIVCVRLVRSGKLQERVARSRFSAESWAAALWIVIGVIGSFGLNTFFHTFLYKRTFVFEGLRVASRWAVVAYAGLAVWAALGATVLLQRWSGWRKVGVAVVLLVAAVADVMPRIMWDHVDPEPPPVYRWLATHRIGPVFEMPPTGWEEYTYLLHATSHRVPIMNGSSGYEPPEHRMLRVRYENAELNDGYTDALERLGCRIVIVHSDLLGRRSGAVRNWLRQGLASGRLGYINRFDEDVEGGWAFAVTKNFSNWKGLRAAYNQAADVEKFLASQPVYSGNTIARVEQPRPDQEIFRWLRIEGWALSHDGIREVRAYLQNGTRSYVATLYPRPDIAARFPWYARRDKAGFVIEVPQRPAKVWRMTNLHVEITDGKGRVERLPSMRIRWH